MTEKEKLQLAQKYIDYLARGFNPITEEAVSNSDVVRNKRISRCLIYVSEVLGQVIDKGIKEEKEFSYKKQEKVKKSEFTITDEEKSRFVFSDNSLTVSEIANGLSSLVDGEKFKPLKATVINEWLTFNGFLKDETGNNGKSSKAVTDEGFAIGISSIDRMSEKGYHYKRIIHSRQSQEFIVDNLDAIIEYNNTRSSVKKVEKAQKPQKSEGRYMKQFGKYDYILDEVIADLHNAGATVDDIVYTTDQDRNYIIDRMKAMKLI